MPVKWITPEHPKIDRVTCPWLRFMDLNADIIYVNKGNILVFPLFIDPYRPNDGPRL